MKLFKNNIGRPSNETLKKRKMILTLLVVFLIGAVIGGFYFISNIFFRVESDLKQATSNIKSNKMKVEIKTTSDSRGILVGEYKYLNWLSQDEIGSNDVYANADGKTQIYINTTFDKDFFNSLANENGNSYVMTIRAYNTSNKETWRSTSVGINTSNFNAEKNNKNKVVAYSKKERLTLNADVRYFKVMVENAKTFKSKYYVQINTALYPTIQIIPSKGQPNSDGIVTVIEKGLYGNTIKINNPSKVTVYWRWYNYDGFNDSTPKQGSCKKITGDKTFTKSLGIINNISEKKGYLRIYNSKSACKEDDRAKKSNQTTGNKQRKYYIAKETIKYQLSTKVYNAGANWMRLKFDYDGLKKSIGKQKTNLCFDCGLAYGVYILSGGQKISTRKNGQNHRYYGATEYFASNEKELYKAIKNKIDAAIPVLIHVNDGNSSLHWVLVTGYKKEGIIKVKASNLKDHLYVLDPYDISHNKMKSEKHAKYVAKENSGSFRYITWEKASDAKAY